ncbi:MAG: hypothetical protein ACWA5A_19335 [Marinibacterium sp.]
MSQLSQTAALTGLPFQQGSVQAVHPHWLEDAASRSDAGISENSGSIFFKKKSASA